MCCRALIPRYTASLNSTVEKYGDHTLISLVVTFSEQTRVYQKSIYTFELGIGKKLPKMDSDQNLESKIAVTCTIRD